VSLLETSKELQSDRDEMSSVDMNIDDFPHPDTLFFWARKNGDAPSRKSSISPRCVDDGICHAAATSEIPETGPFSSESLVGANDEDGHMNLMLDKGEVSVLDVTRSENHPFSHQSRSLASGIRPRTADHLPVERGWPALLWKLELRQPAALEQEPG
jgi:hypothetical protein